MKIQKHSAALVLTWVVLTLPVFAATGTVPPGSKLQVRVTERLSSDTAKAGDTFHGMLAQPVIVNGKILFTKGTEVKGEVIAVSKSGRLSSPGQLQLVLTSIDGGWFRSYPLSVQPLVLNGGSHTKNNVTKIGGGAAAGAIVGGVAAGGKGAAIGAGVGAGAGTAVAAATGKREAVVESEMLLTWTTNVHQPATSSRAVGVNPAAYRERGEHRERDDSGYAANQGRHHHDDDDEDDSDRRDDRGGNDVFSAHDRVVFRSCLGGGDYSNLPPGLAKRDRLPPGLEKQLQRNGTLPPGLQKRVQPLPQACEVQLPRLPAGWVRVILSGRIILLDKTQRILDILELGRER
jgi:hypothetical protein